MKLSILIVYTLLALTVVCASVYSSCGTGTTVGDTTNTSTNDEIALEPENHTLINVENNCNLNNGNLYKPEDDLKIDYYKSYGDITALCNIVNDASRLTDPATWQANLETILDVDTFLQWLAANTILEDSDTCKVMPHNFYLYNDPDTQRFEWIPWYDNEAFIDERRNDALNMSTISFNWPLIRYIMDVPEYEMIYQEYVEDFASSCFQSSSSTRGNGYDRYDTYQILILPYVAAEASACSFTSYEEFTAAVDYQKIHKSNRYISAWNYVGW